MVFLYIANTGLAKTCCTIVGQYIGNGDIKTAQIYFNTFIIHGVINSTILNIFQYVFFYEMISIYTSIPEIQDQIMSVRLLFISHTWADLFKAILYYTVKALGIQSKGKYVNMIGQMIIYPLGTLLLAFRFNMGLYGFFLSKIIAVASNALGYYFII